MKTHFPRACPAAASLALIAGAALFFVTPSSASAQQTGSTAIVALSGDALPDGNGTFSIMLTPSINDAGEVIFGSILAGTSGGASDDRGSFRGGGGAITQIAREGQAAPGGNGIFSFLSSLGSLPVNDAGQTAFLASLSGTSGGSSDDFGIFRGAGGTITQIAREGQTAPDGNGTVSSLTFVGFNNSGEAALLLSITGSSGGSSDGPVLFRADGAATPVQIAREGQTVPDGNGAFSGLGSGSTPLLNNSGQIAFTGRLAGTSGGASDDYGIFLGDGANPLLQVVREGQAAPDGNGVFDESSAQTFNLKVDLNEAGRVAFTARLRETAGGISDRDGIFIGDGTNPLVQLLRTGQAAPDGNGSWSSFGLGAPVLNDVGQVALNGFFTGTSGGSSDDSGIALRDGGSGFVQVARKGQAAPGGNGVFSFFRDPVLNNAGQVAFSANLSGTSGGSSDNNGIFFFDPARGLLTVVRKGDALLGSTIESLAFANGVTQISNAVFNNPEEYDGLNDLGQVAYGFTLADGRSGIAVWSPFTRLIQAGSRKTHGSAGTFEIDLALTGAPGVECRSSNGDHTLDFVFSNDVVSGNASMSEGAGSVNGSPTFSGNTMTVNLTGVTDAQEIKITLSGVTDASAEVLPNLEVKMRVLLGDTTGNSSVTSSDIGQTKAQSGIAVTEVNARQDVTANGAITSSDIGLVKSRSGTSIPTSPPTGRASAGKRR